MQMLLILTKSVNRCFEKNSKFDMTPLLGGTDAVFSSLIHSFSWFVSLSLFVIWNAFCHKTFIYPFYFYFFSVSGILFCNSFLLLKVNERACTVPSLLDHCTLRT